MAGDIKVIGIAGAVRNLQQLGEAITKRVTRKAVRAATALISKAVKQGAYGPGRQRQTGLLGRSLAMTVSTKQRGLVVGKVVARPVSVTGRSKVAQRVRSAKKAKLNNATEMTAFYWRFLEKGTKARATRSGADRGSVTARPWVVPTFDNQSGAAIDRFAEVFNRETDAEARKLPKGVQR